MSRMLTFWAAVLAVLCVVVVAWAEAPLWLVVLFGIGVVSLLLVDAITRK